MTDYLINYRRTRRPGYVAGIQPSTLPGLYPTANLNFHIKADSLALSDGDKVASWTELIFGNHPVQATESQKPTFKTGIINGLPVVRFNSTDSGGLVSPSLMVPWPGTGSYYFVLRRDTTADGIIIRNGADTGYYHSNGTGLGSANTGNINGFYDAGDGNGRRWINTGVAFGTTAPVLVSKHLDTTPTYFKFYRNGSYINSFECVGVKVGDINYGYFGWDGWGSSISIDIAEIMVYTDDHSLDAEKRQQVEAYLNSKYALW